MTSIAILEGCPEAALAASLAEFESEFRYPLGEGRWFRISHDDDYTRFFRAIGDARCFVAQRNGKVSGVVSVARCRLRSPGGGFVDASYVADLKIGRQGDGATLIRLLRPSVAWARITPSTPGFSVVMDGTSRDPTSYTGRLQIPPYIRLAGLTILRIPTDLLGASDAREASPDDVHACYRDLTRGHFATDGGSPERRSVMQPTGMILPDGAACGLIEDTRRCKRLYLDDDTEMVSAHLSCFGYHTPGHAVDLIAAACLHCRQLDFPALFVALPAADSGAILSLLPQQHIVVAPATVFGFGLPPGKNWSVNTSEI